MFNYKEAEWLVEFSKNTLGLKLQGQVLEDYYEAERLLKGKDEIDKRSCTCHYKSLAKMVNSLWDQYKQTVLDIYNEGPKEETKKRSSRSKDS